MFRHLHVYSEMIFKCKKKSLVYLNSIVQCNLQQFHSQSLFK